MQSVLLVALILVACALALPESKGLVGYHESVGIPLAKRTKALEDAILANRKPDSRIVGGSVAPRNAHPYLAGLLINFVNHVGTSVCGASLISANRLVTAAQCWFDGRLLANRFVVVLGSPFLFSEGQRIATSSVILNPQWNPSTRQNDIAVINLPWSVHIAENIRPIALPQDLSDSFEGEWAVAAGYGKTNNDQAGVPIQSAVNHVNLKVISVSQCQAVYGPWARPTNVCTSGVGGVGICGGDIGGPLFVTHHGQRILIGVASFVAAAGCHRGYPSSFTRVTSYYGFIKSHM